MCGVVGFFGKYRNYSKVIHKVIHESAVRGVHSFGFSYLHNGIILTEKRHKVEDIIQCLDEIGPDKFIFHNRYSTTGDFLDHENNQPVNIESFSLVFNGVISQASREKNEETYQLALSTTNDGEIFARTKNKQAFIEEHSGSFAGLYCDGKDFYAFRNKRRPLWYSGNNETVFVASTRDILKRAEVPWEYLEFEAGEIIKL